MPRRTTGHSFMAAAEPEPQAVINPHLFKTGLDPFTARRLSSCCFGDVPLIAIVTLILVGLGLVHVWLQLYNRRLLLLRDTPRKPTIHHLSVWLLVFLPLTLLAWVSDREPFAAALSWSPDTAESRVVFLFFGFLWVFALYRFGSWFAGKVVPVRSDRLVSEQTRVPRLASPESALPRVLRSLETTHDLHVRRLEIEVPSLAAEFDGLTIAMVSDVHYDPRHNQVSWFDDLAEIVNGFDADVVAFTGDFVNRRGDVQESVAFHARMKGRLATLVALGNHDDWTNPRLIRTECRRHGLRLMHNRRWTIERHGRRLTFAGTDSPWGKRRSNWPRLLRKDPGESLVLLSHTPDNTPCATKHGANLILSGHNHGGQACLPLVGAVIVPSRHGHRYLEGVIDAGPEAVLVVSRGIGSSPGIFGWNGRILCPPEVILLTLRAPAVEVTAPVFNLQDDVKGAVVAAMPG